MGHPDPIAFEIAGIEIRWYGILIAAGMLLAVLISSKRAHEHGIKDDDVYDTFQAGKEYEATYDPPFILSPRSSFYVNSGKSICGWLWEDFHEYWSHNPGS